MAYRTHVLRPGWHALIALVLGLVFTALMAAVTNRIPPDWDALHYVDMSRNGLFANDGLTAPFAYRFGMPLLFGMISDLTGTGIEAVYRGGAFVASVAFFVLVYLIAERVARSWKAALITTFLVVMSYWHIKFTLFFDTLLDIHAVSLVCLAWYLILLDRPVLAACVGIVGLCVKEWLGVPVALVTGIAARAGLRDRDRSQLALAGAVVAAAIAAIVLPRALIEVVHTDQFIDPVNDVDWIPTLVRVLSDKVRWFNLGLATLSYWLPLLLLLRADRIRPLLADLSARNLLGVCLLHVVLVTCLAFLGGTNLNVFVSYSAPVLAILLASILARGVPGWEVAGALAVLVVFNRLLIGIPDPRIDFIAYLDYLPPYASRYGSYTWMRSLELLAAFAGFRIFVAAITRLTSPVARRQTVPPRNG